VSVSARTCYRAVAQKRSFVYSPIAQQRLYSLFVSRSLPSNGSLRHSITQMNFMLQRVKIKPPRQIPGSISSCCRLERNAQKRMNFFARCNTQTFTVTAWRSAHLLSALVRFSSVCTLHGPVILWLACYWLSGFKLWDLRTQNREDAEEAKMLIYGAIITSFYIHM
jgi:hypothetical protein